MLLEHVKFSFEVELTTDGHVGDGEHIPLKLLRPGFPFEAEADAPDSEVATLVRDHRDRPTLPSTGIKGALRKALLRQMAMAEVDALFGSIKSESEGSMGQFALYAGELDESTINDDLLLPYWDQIKLSWIATHVAISRRHGAAERKKLFSREMIPAGSVFRISGVWFSTLERAVVNLPRLLAPFAADEGLSIGGGTKLGQGAVRFRRKSGQVKLQHIRFVPETGKVQDSVVSESLTVRPIASVDRSVKLKLACPGPFISVDTARRRGANDGNKISALKRNETTPVLHLSSIAGALRSRATWLSECQGLGRDDRFRKPSSWTDIAQLSPVERLFGVAGWRGLLRLSQPEMISASGRRELSSNSLDRFSGAVLDGALFRYEVFTGIELHFAMTLETRRDALGNEAPLQADKDLFDALLGDLAGDVLMLGHATNRGFGWFDVQSIDRGEAA